MRGDGTAGWARAGCGGLGFLAVLVAVGISISLDLFVLNNSPSSSPRPRLATSSTTVAVTTAPPPAPGSGVEVQVTPATDLGEETPVTVTARGFDPGAQVRISTCLHRGGPVVTGDTCDPDGVATATADGTGRVAADYRPRRVVTVGGIPFDCASSAGACDVRVAATADPARSGGAPISYADGLPNPALVPNLGG